MSIEVGSQAMGLDSGLSTIHPSVTSTIRSEDVSYQSNTGQLKAFMAFTSDKGEDNVVRTISSPDEFIFKFGKPNLKKHGQTAYNAMNFLNAGGSIEALRVMPENAGFAHAFLNILTRTETKKVRDVDGELVSARNVVLKPAVAYTEINNASDQLLAYELRKERSEYTVDGFKNHLIFAIRPTGRGESYNDLGFRITLNTSFDDLNFRVYNFEVIRFDEYNTANIIEGPFYVSLYPDALSNSNESMFIQDVINKYSQHVRCIFNEDEYIRLCSTINPSEVGTMVRLLDPLTGVTRNANENPDMFFCKETQKFEDIHMYIHRYDSGGRVVLTGDEVPQVNIVDAKDLIEQSVLLADNVYRKNMYDRYKKNIDYMKVVFNSLNVNNYNKIIDELLYTPDGVTPESGLIVEMIKKLNGYSTNIQNLVNIFNTSKLESDFNRIVTENKLVEQGIKDTMKLIVQLLSYHKAIETSADVLDVDAKVNSIYDKLNLKEVIDIRSISKKDKIDEIANLILSLKANGSIDDQADQLTTILSDVKGVIDYLVLIINENELSATEINKVVDSYNVVIDLYNAVFQPYLSEESVKNLIAEIYKELDLIVNDCYSITQLTIANIDLIIISDIITKKVANVANELVVLTYTNKGLFAEKMASQEGRDELLSNVKKNINNMMVVVSVMKSIVYTNQLQDFNAPTRFMNGSDGDLTDSNSFLKTVTTEKLLVQAYKGLIDSAITSRKTCPFHLVLDANYSVNVKNAITTLVREIRKDVFYYADSGFKSNPEDALSWRTTEFNVSSQFVGIYTQDLIVFDEYNGRDIKVTPTFLLASKIPAHATQFGLHYPIAGNRRGLIDSYKAISFIPNETYKEKLYKKQLNYIESDTKKTRFGSQLTADMKRTPLSNINNALTALDIKRNVEDMAEDYQFEFEDDDTIRTFQYNLNDFLNRYVTNKSCAEISAKVYASDYDKQQHVLRVAITVRFHGIIERIVINIDVVK